jgi:hypothetical protein
VKARSDDGRDAGVNQLVDLLAMGLSNAVNFTRVNRLVLASDLLRASRFAEALVTRLKDDLLRELSTRVQVEQWDQPASSPAESAGWLALASIYREGWLG